MWVCGLACGRVLLLTVLPLPSPRVRPQKAEAAKAKLDRREKLHEFKHAIDSQVVEKLSIVERKTQEVSRLVVCMRVHACACVCMRVHACACVCLRVYDCACVWVIVHACA